MGIRPSGPNESLLWLMHRSKEMRSSLNVSFGWRLQCPPDKVLSERLRTIQRSLVSEAAVHDQLNTLQYI